MWQASPRGGEGRLYPDPDVVGLLIAALLLTVVVTPLVGWAVLHRFRVAVRRGMSAMARAPFAAPPPPSVEARSPDVARPATASGPSRRHPTFPATLISTSDPALAGMVDVAAVQTIRRRMGATLAAYLAAALAYGIVAAVVVLASGDFSFLPRRTLALVLLYAWPIVPTVIAIGAARLRTAAVAWAVYIALLVGVTTGSGIGLQQLAVLMALTILPPGLLLVALSGRNLRAVGPFLAPPIFVLACGLLAWPWAVVALLDAGAGGAVAVAMVSAAVLATAGATVTYLWWAARSYRRRRVSDQMQTISQWWFLATMWSSAALIPAGVGWSLGLWCAYAAFRGVLPVTVRRIPRQPSGPHLLLLRTFGAARRSERMLRRVSTGWRHIGSIQLVAGIDLAASTLEPHEFLDFLSGRLSDRFIRGPEDLQRQLAHAESGTDPDGRFRITDLFCHDDTWRPVVRTLLQTSDAVLMDLRGFTAANGGVVYELGQLVALARLSNVVLVTDATTDHELLDAVLVGAWHARGMPATAPLRVLRLHGEIAAGPLLGLLTAAAEVTPDLRPTGPPPAPAAGTAAPA